MKNLKVSLMLRALLLVAVVVALGTIPFLPSQTSAARPGPDCGPTWQWICVVEGEEIPFEGTICEKLEFEMETGGVCSPA